MKEHLGGSKNTKYFNNVTNYSAFFWQRDGERWVISDFFALFLPM
jgi:hypothetical protein